MKRRILSLIVLFTILLHGASRTGVLSWVYAQRHEIAYALHLTNERVIAECRSDYFSSNELRIHAASDDTRTSDTIASASEINLFSPVETGMSLNPEFILIEDPATEIVSKKYSSLRPEIFHPPGA